MMKIGVVDDHNAVRIGIKKLLEGDKKLAVVLEASDGMELLQLLRDRRNIPDILILDIVMPNMGGMKVIELLQDKYPSIKIIVYSFLSDKNTIRSMIHKGASGFVTKAADVHLLTKAIYDVFNNGISVWDGVGLEFFEKGRLNHRSGFNGNFHLTENEILFIKYAASGLTYKEVACRLGKTEKSIEKYREHLFKKLKVPNRSALIVYGFLTGLIDTVNIETIN